MTEVKDPNKGRGWRIAIQVIGFLAGLAALGWCLKTAFKPENRAQFAKLGEAPASLLVAMLGLSLATLVLNGLAFWISICPVRRLKVMDVIATNGVCSFLGYVPFKAGAIVRFIIHNRRDKVPVATIGAWFTALAVVMAATFTVMCVSAIKWGRLDAAWAAMTLGGTIAAGVLIVGLATRFRGEKGLQRIERLVGFTRIAALKKPLRWNVWLQLHSGFDMLASPVAVGGGMTIRLIDSAVQAMRFVIAARIFGVELTAQQALLVSLLYFVVGVASPSGLVGLRDGAAAVLAGKLLERAGLSSEQGRDMFTAVALLVSATEAAAYLFGGAVGLAWLRPDRLLKLRDKRESSQGAVGDRAGGREPPDGLK